MDKHIGKIIDLPQVIAELRDEVSGMKALLLNVFVKP